MQKCCNGGWLIMREKMYVRCAADRESMINPRVFICGQIMKIDDFKKTIRVKIYDPFSLLLLFEELPRGEIEIPIAMAQHCTFFVGSSVVYKNSECKVLSSHKSQNGFYYYYLQNVKNKNVLQASEADIIAAFNNGCVDPSKQLKQYEFQNPCWYLGHSVVSKSMNVLDNSIYGFKELAGSKIYLLAHQINTIMRCLQENPCRYMLADEVGMGKTIEAISVFKIYMKDRNNQKALVIVPKALKEQWLTELFLKFGIAQENDANNNSIKVKAISELCMEDVSDKWDFVIIDEVHRYLGDEKIYGILHSITRQSRNILLLSATPVQQRQEEYLSLLRLLLPAKYDKYSIEEFGRLVDKQSQIIQKTALILDDLEDYEEEINSVSEQGNNPHESEDCQDLYEEIHDGLEEICEELDDDKLCNLFKQIEFDNDGLGVYQIKVIISYICSNYQIESNIIRNRRKLLENSNTEERLLPVRKLESIVYDLDNERNTYETITYELLSDWIEKHSENGPIFIQEQVRPLLSAFFSSPWAFIEEMKAAKNRGQQIDTELISSAKKWMNFESHIVDNVNDIINDPDKYDDCYSTRLISVLNAVYDEYYDKKIVLFTNYPETFEVYRAALGMLFSEEEISCFGESLSSEDLELNAYRFQNDSTCRIMLCDYTGGEGRNFQCADYIVHIDIPWDANMIEQRIGRLDRLERDPARPIVHSIVVYTRETFEEALFKFWNEGLKIFTQSLSGMEIIMNDINSEIIDAVQQDFKFGLFDRIPNIIKLADDMRTTVRKEQNFDAAGFIYRPMYNELRRLINYYAQNENELFARTMTNWASLAGFHGHSNSMGIITYSEQSFVPKSAKNALLIPPRWKDYMSSAQNVFVDNIQRKYSKAKSVRNQERAIRGTFLRKQAIENDYLHFFAPGDAVFDCIVDNAMLSCKGRSSAFAIHAEFNWTGIIYTWSLSANIDYLLESGVSIYALSPYRNYLMSEQIISPISLNNEEDISDVQIIREYNRIVEAGFHPKNVVHLGKRSMSPGFLRNQLEGPSNIDWFRKEYTEENWKEIIESTRKESYARAAEIFKKRSNVRGAREEMERTLSARAANADYFGLTDIGIEELKKTQKIILESIRRPKIVLDSAAFVWMVKYE